MTVFNSWSCYWRHKKQNKILQTIISIIFWHFLIFYQVLLSPQVKRCAIITYEHDIYALPQALPNELRLRSSLWKHFLASGSTQAPPNLVSLTILVTSRNLTQFQSKVRAIKLEISAQMCFTGSCFTIFWLRCKFAIKNSKSFLRSSFRMIK